MKYPKSGQATGVPDATQCINLMGFAKTSGRRLFLLKANFFNDIVSPLSGSVIGLWDLAAATGAPSTTALKVLVTPEYSADQLTTLDFPDPGMEFGLGCCVGLQSGCTATGYTVCSGVGYEI